MDAVALLGVCLFKRGYPLLEATNQASILNHEQCPMSAECFLSDRGSCVLADESANVGHD